MSMVSEILAHKGPSVHAVQETTSVVDAATVMNQHRIGAVVVKREQKLVGIFTERDILMRVVAARRDPAATLVRDVMTRQLMCCRPDTPVEEVQVVMRNRRIRHLPVVSHDQELLGMISIGDLNAWHLNGQEQTIHSLKEYLYGSA